VASFYVFLTKKTSGFPLIQSWLKEQAISFSVLEDFSNLIPAIHQVKLEKNCKILVIDYFFESSEDIQNLENFLSQMKKEKQSCYYAPRPNAYISVQTPCFIFVPSYEKFAQAFPKQIQTTMPFLKASRLFAPYMPRFLKTFLKNTILPLLASKPASNNPVSQTSAIKSTQESKEEIKVVQPYLPNLLASWPLDWKSWEAPLNMQKRDLIDRIQYFFPYPLGIHVILANKCNLSCVMCPYHSPKYKGHHTSGYFDEKRSMSFDVFKTIADFAGKNKITLQFGQIEEPLLHPQIFDFMGYAKQVGVPSMHITTNGTLLTKEKADRLANSGVTSVMFSLDASDPDTYRKIRGFHLDKTEANIKHFLDISQEKGIKTWVSFILQAQPEEERQLFLKKWQDLGIDNVTFYVLTDHDPKTGAAIRTEEFYEKGVRYACASPWIQSVVFPDGDVSLCCKTMLDVGWQGVVSVGNLAKNSFDEVWRSNRYNMVRKELLSNSFKVFESSCKDCMIWSASTQNVEVNQDHTVMYNETMKTYTFHRQL
jgi:MoaA/NifB/PqqE/SkfB family radical SAM enzyme